MMKEENELNGELKQLLDTLEEHGKNARRQKELGNLIDGLASDTLLRGGTKPATKEVWWKQSRHEATAHHSDTSTSDETSSLDRFVPSDGAKRRRLIPLWWVMGVAAACLLLWLLVKPTTKQTPETNEEILVEKTNTVDSIETKVKETIFEEPVILEEPLAEETQIVPQKTQTMKEKPKEDVIEQVAEQPALAEVISTEPVDTTKNIGSNPISTENETPSAVQKPQRRVIRSLNLVCYECQKDPEIYTKPVLEDKTLFGQPQDPNMKNGSLAFELKLN